ncbi:MAG: hypothetical protein LC781_08850 [Actinobacteria bacterium]|nr:hypothetical protein [Actinomycetota bacterium]
MVYGVAEVNRGNLPPEDHPKVMETLQVFSEVVAETCEGLGLMRGSIPFVRPANFVVVLDSSNLHLVVDNTPVGAIPDHTYIDERHGSSRFKLVEQVVGFAVQDGGFRDPIAVDIPAFIMEVDDRQQKKSHLQVIATYVCDQWAERAKIERLDLPEGFQHLSRFFPRFFEDHPNVDQNVFLMMRFKTGEQYEEITETLRREMGKYGLHVIRADDKDYTGDLWENVCLYMLGSTYGVAIFEEIDEREFNPNIALELGFMLTLNKRCLILKDQRMPKMPTDIVGKLYKEFDTYNIETSVTRSVEAWAHDIGLR